MDTEQRGQGSVGPTGLLTPEEVADRLRVSRRTVYRWLDGRQLQGQKVGRGWRISEEKLAAFLAAQNDGQ